VAGWLPAPVAEAIDRRAAAARVMLGPAQEAPTLPAASRAVMAEATGTVVPLAQQRARARQPAGGVAGWRRNAAGGAGAAWTLSGHDMPGTPRAGAVRQATTTTPTVPVREHHPE
jgi:hypothetical protein